MIKAKVLVVDDDPYILDIIRVILAGEDIELTVAETGEQALDAMERQLPDIIIQDLNLPDMNGLELNRMLLSYDPEMPIIALTGVEIKLGDSVSYRGFVTFLLKPIEPEKLLQVIQRFLRNQADPEKLSIY